MNIKFVMYVLGALLLIEGGLMVLPVFIALLYGEPNLLPMLYPPVIAFVTGGTFWYFNRGCSKEISKHEGFIIVSTVWIVYAFFGSLPYVFSGYIPSVTDAFFETMSGFTTTGGTIIKDVEALPHSLLFWRTLTHFTGGIGILVLCIAVLPIFGTGNMMIYQAEVSVGKFSPRVKDTAKHIFRIYLILTIACTLFYLPDMGIFDAVCHAFSTTATGGFSNKNASMGAYSIYSQYVSIFFMFMGGSSFILFFHGWKREYHKISHNDEYRFYLLITLAASAFISIGLIVNGTDTEPAIREGLFNVVSILTTTGYALNDFMVWTPPLWFIIFLLMFVGGCAGSTAGGLKIVRFLLLFRMIPVQFKKIIHQNAIIQVKLNKQTVPQDRMFSTLAFFMVFLLVYTIGVFGLIICGMDFTSAAGASIACLANSGPGLEMVGPASTYADVSTAGKWICSTLMLVGRLELYSVLILLSPAFWKKL